MISQNALALFAFMATGATFGEAKSNMKSPLRLNKKERARGQTHTTSLSRKAGATLAKQTAVKPVTLLTATSSEDTEQAWRTVRNYFGMEIFLDFDIGTPSQTLSILIDSGSDWFWVTTDRCRWCGGETRYNPKESSTYNKVGTDEVLLQYGSGDAKGDHIQETVCLSTKSDCDGFFCEQVCVEDMNMLGINWQSYGLRALVSDGLMGLSPVEIGDERPDLFINLAYNQGVLDERVFSIHFAGDDNESYITFGGYDADEFAVEEITWHDNVGEYFWAVQLDEVRIGEGENEKVYEWKNSTAAVVDSGSSYLLVPEEYFWDFFDQLSLVNDIYCEVDWYGSLYCVHELENFDSLPELHFKIEGKDYTVPRESLYVPIEEYPGLMAVEMTYISGWNEWLFGLTFLENYYAVYDMDQQKIGFALSNTSTMAPTTETPVIQDTTVLLGASAPTESVGLTASHTAMPAIAVLATGLLYKMCKTKTESRINQQPLLTQD